MKGKDRLRRILTAVLAAVFCLSAGMVIAIWVRGRHEEEAFRDLAGIMHSAQSAAESRPEPQSSPASRPEPQSSSASHPEEGGEQPPAGPEPAEEPAAGLAALREQNSDVFGWLTIEGTGVDYPVMFTPEDPEHYLRRAFDGTWSQSGVPFLDGACTPEGNHFLVYGHNMDNGTMFAPLLQYRDRSFFEAHPTVLFETEDGPAVYEIFSVFYSEAYPQDAENVFRYYYCQDLSTQEAFDSFVFQAKAASVYDTGITPAWGETLLTLSTCSYHTDEGRFVVTCRRAPAQP